MSNTAKILMKIYLDVCCINRPFDDQTERQKKKRVRCLEGLRIRCSRCFCDGMDWNWLPMSP